MQQTTRHFCCHYLIKWVYFLLLFAYPQVIAGDISAQITETSLKNKKKFEQSPCIIKTQKIVLEEYPDAFNPSILQNDQGYLLSFRYCPDRTHDEFSCLGIVQLNDVFEPISTPQLLETRNNSFNTPHAQDARLISHNNKIYLIYNDNPDLFFPQYKDRRDMYLAELVYVDGVYSLQSKIFLRHMNKHHERLWQKNWVPFVSDNRLLLGYTIQPHEILQIDFATGLCTPIYMTQTAATWKFGTELRGGTPALLHRNHYLAFFHSETHMYSEVSKKKKLHHYFMGAYMFSKDAPFTITAISKKPLVGKYFYTTSSAKKRVIYPGGFCFSKKLIYLAYGKDDREIWIATLDRKLLADELVPIR